MLVSKSLDVGGNERIQRAKRLRDDLRHLRERWNNRLVLEDGTFGKGYIDGNSEVVIVCDNRLSSGNHYNLAVRIPAHAAVLNGICADKGAYTLDAHNGDVRQKIVVLVEVTKAGSGPQIQVRIPTRLYVFNNEIRKLGEGLPYRFVRFGGFKILPFSRKREMKIPTTASRAVNGIYPEIHRFPQIIHGITDNWREIFADKFLRTVSELKAIRIDEDYYRSGRPISNLVKIIGQRGRPLEQRVDVLVGPFDL